MYWDRRILPHRNTKILYLSKTKTKNEKKTVVDNRIWTVENITWTHPLSFKLPLPPFHMSLSPIHPFRKFYNSSILTVVKWKSTIYFFMTTTYTLVQVYITETTRTRILIRLYSNKKVKHTVPFPYWLQSLCPNQNILEDTGRGKNERFHFWVRRPSYRGIPRQNQIDKTKESSKT